MTRMDRTPTYVVTWKGESHSLHEMGWHPPNYRRGYSTRNYHVTGEHEAEAIAAERAKKPTRLARLVLRLLGDKGTPGDRNLPAPPHR
jgi:hypothetical protein